MSLSSETSAMAPAKNPCLILIGGIPGSGKTTFAKSLKEKLRDSTSLCLLVSYDDILPVHKQKQLSESEEEWMKVFRKDTLRFVECVLTKTNFVPQSSLPLVFPETPALDPAFVILDDNFYYKSMRYEFYQLAKKYELGFCQFLLQCPSDIALKRNENRPSEERVPEKVVLEMASKFETADPMKNRWEQFSFVLPLAVDKQTVPIEMVVELAKMARSNPVTMEDLSEKKERSDRDRELCNASVVHQSDKVLRKIVGDEVKKCIGNPQDQGGSVKVYSGKLNELRVKILDDMKCGLLFICRNLMAKFKAREEEALNELQEWLVDVFENEKKALFDEAGPAT